MRVVSSLADIDFGIGQIARAGRNLVIRSSPESTIATSVTMTPADARKSLGALVSSPSAWLFILSLPFSFFGGEKRADPSNAWVERRQRIGLNKPW